MKKGKQIQGQAQQINQYFKCYNLISPSELEIEVKIAAIELAKQQQQETHQQNNYQFNQFLGKLNKIENQKDEQNEYWKNGTNHALIILKYLDDQSSFIIENSDKKLRESDLLELLK
ncbi:unnamed protein product [Paramecium pentaurelia]|uniref:Uncharacterized protein n=1 Tax=Paramecium pentaurelia TaxID=43138 RepID=A0A8S1YP92_9CILI|nr:unnamed protein product [Paramecium pentaurelia]